MVGHATGKLLLLLFTANFIIFYYLFFVDIQKIIDLVISPFLCVEQQPSSYCVNMR